MEVPNGHFVNFLIGAHGVAISALQRDTGCNIQIEPAPAGRQPSLVSVRRRDDASTSVIRLGPGLTCGGVVDDDIFFFR